MESIDDLRRQYTEIALEMERIRVISLDKLKESEDMDDLAKCVQVLHFISGTIGHLAQRIIQQERSEAMEKIENEMGMFEEENFSKAG